MFAVDGTGSGWDICTGVIVVRTSVEEKCSSLAVCCCLSGGSIVTTGPPSSGTSLVTTKGGGVSSNIVICRMGLAGAPLEPPLAPDAISFS